MSVVERYFKQVFPEIDVNDKEVQKYILFALQFATQMCERQKRKCFASAYVVKKNLTWDIDPETNQRYSQDELKQMYKNTNAELYCKDNGESFLYYIEPESIVKAENVCGKN